MAGTPPAWPSYASPPAAAFVDVDGTLLAETTTFLFARMLHRRGLIGRAFFARAAYHGLQHRFGRLDYGRLVDFGLRSIGRVPVIDLERIAYENFAENIKPRLYPGVVEHFDALRRSGTPIVLVSSSPGLVIQPLAIYLGCADTLTTPVLIRNHRLIGLGEGPPCYGPGKLHWAERWAEERSIPLGDSAAYADNWSDRALLDRVGHAVAVNPRGKLLGRALRRGWSVVRARPPLRPEATAGRGH